MEFCSLGTRMIVDVRTCRWQFSVLNDVVVVVDVVVSTLRLKFYFHFSHVLRLRWAISFGWRYSRAVVVVELRLLKRVFWIRRRVELLLCELLESFLELEKVMIRNLILSFKERNAQSMQSLILCYWLKWANKSSKTLQMKQFIVSLCP